uniref:Large ribosomal subunit protein uL18c n=1 Tax=Melanthalia intermedia TaxID=172989 RepID=A0A345UAW3_9FLOR|nr:ribosomal protein L18 [Melanthalia intermedia]AXI97599.1 ribosomal protein L18 [Melanthalia intermedia]
MMRKKIEGSSYRPRLCVFRSNKHIYAQIIDDKNKKTIASSSTIDKKIRQSISSTGSCAAARSIGQDIAKKSKEKGINKVVFDRRNRIYHGRIKALAEGVRTEGIRF